jgi:hypothetical protein
LYVSPNVIRVIKSRRVTRRGHVTLTGEMSNAYKIFVGKPEEKIILQCREIDRVHLVQDSDHWRAVVYTVMNLRFP